MSHDLVAPDYVKVFKCMADKCEDTCCQAWDVRYEKSSYETLINKAVDDQQRNFLKSYIKLYSKDDHSSFHAYIKMKDDAFCPFLTEELFCQLQKTYGAEVLSNVCALYPRVINQLGSKYEVNGTLSCPEMVRACISAESPETYFTNTDETVLPQQSRLSVQRKLDIDSVDKDSYLKNFFTVREAMQTIVSRSNDNLLMQLYTLALYTSQISDFYFSGCGAVRKSELTRIMNTVIKGHDRSEKYLDTIESDNEFSENFIISLLQTNIKNTSNENYKKLITTALNQHNKLCETHETNSVFSLQDNTQAVLRDKIDKVATSYLLNCIYREWYNTLPNTFVYIFMIVVRLAMIRFVAQILLRVYVDENKIEVDSEKNLDNKEFDKKMVEIIYLHARAVDHNMPYLQVVYHALAEQDMFNMDFILPLIKCRT